MTRAELQERILELQQRFASVEPMLSFSSKEQEFFRLQKEMEDPSFWNDLDHSQKISKRVSFLQRHLDFWKKMKQEILEMGEFLSLTSDEGLLEFEKNFLFLESEFFSAETELLLSGEYDHSDAILSLYVGNGGQDAEDFTQMLARMYLRFCEAKKWDIRFLDESRTDAGLKSIMFEVIGEFAYGFLKSEHGVHRLIRLSPFNAKALRQTSFARVEVLPKLESSEIFEIPEKDLRIDVFRSSGSGGQSVNTTDSAVRITYLPLNIVVSCQNERSQLQNKESAMSVLRARLLQLQLEQRAQKISDIRGDILENSFGSQIRTYTLQPYKLVKDHRTEFEHNNPDKVFDGDISGFIDAYLRMKK